MMTYQDQLELAHKHRQETGDYPARWRMAAQLLSNGRCSIVNPVSNPEVFSPYWQNDSPMKSLSRLVAANSQYVIVNIGVYNQARDKVTMAVLPAFTHTPCEFIFRCRYSITQDLNNTPELMWFSLEVLCDGQVYVTKVRPDMVVIDQYRCDARIAHAAEFATTLESAKEQLLEAKDTLTRTQLLEVALKDMIKDGEECFATYSQLDRMRETCQDWEADLMRDTEYNEFRIEVNNLRSRITTVLSNVGYTPGSGESRHYAGLALQRFQEKYANPLIADFSKIQSKAKQISQKRGRRDV